MRPSRRPASPFPCRLLLAATSCLLLATALAGCGGGGGSVTIVPTDLLFLTPALPDGTQGVAYSATLTATGGTPPYSWSVSAGSLPAGLSLEASTGKITGTPTTVQTVTFTLQVRDAAGQTATKEFSVSIGDTTPVVERVSLAFDGSPANGDSGSPALTPDGRFVAFSSFASNLVAADTNNLPDIFVRDRACPNTWRASVPNPADQPTLGPEAKTGDPLLPGFSFNPAISGLVGDVLFVAYASDAVNLVLDDTNNQRDIFVTAVDVSNCLSPVILSTARVNVSTDGNQTTLVSTLPSLSVDGSLIAYHSVDPNLTPGKQALGFGVFATDLQFASNEVTPLQTRRLTALPTPAAVRLSVNLPDTTADIFSVNTIGNSSLTMTADEHAGRLAIVMAGAGAGQSLTISSNTATTLTLSANWAITPDNTSVFRITTPSAAADIFSASTIGRAGLGMATNDHVGRTVAITAGTGSGQTRTVIANDDTTLTVDSDWTTEPDATSVFRVIATEDRFADPAFVTETSIGNPDLAMAANEHTGKAIEIISGTGAGLSRNVTGNNATAFAIDPAWPMATIPDGTSVFRLETDVAGDSLRARVSADGAYIAFHSSGALLSDDTNSVQDVYLFERGTDTLTRISLTTTGEEVIGGPSSVSAISGLGNFVLVQSSARCLTVFVPTTTADIFSSTTIGSTTLAMTPDEHVNRLADIVAGTGSGQAFTITSNTATTLTVSPAWTTTPDSTSQFRVCDGAPADLFLRDRAGPSTTQISLTNTGGQPDASSEVPAGLSGGGRLVAFATFASNLVAGDTNVARDVYLRDRSLPETRRLSFAMGNTNPNNDCIEATISLDGTTVAFSSFATNLVPNDTNSASDIFIVGTGVSDGVLAIAPRLGPARQGTAFTGGFQVVGVSEPLFWTVVEGALPPGLFLDTRRGSIAGVPQKDGIYKFTVQVQDGSMPSRRARRTVVLPVAPRTR